MAKSDPQDPKSQNLRKTWFQCSIISDKNIGPSRLSLNVGIFHFFYCPFDPN